METNKRTAVLTTDEVRERTIKLNSVEAEEWLLHLCSILNSKGITLVINPVGDTP